MTRRLAPLVLGALLCGMTFAMTACGGSSSDAGTSRTVGVAFYPIADIVNRLHLGVTADVLVPAGQEAHEYDPTPIDLTRLQRAKVFFYLGKGFQPNVESALGSLPHDVTKVDLLDGLDLLPVTDPLAGTQGEVGGETLDGDLDPHVWLDPTNMSRMSIAIADALVTAGLATRDAADAALAAATRQYDTLDQEFADGLATCVRRDLVTTHRAFGYLTHAHQLTQVSIAGISPSEEPSAKTLEAVAAFVAATGTTTVFSEENLPADLATTVADETGARTDALHTVESPSAEQLQQGDGYLSLMRQNLVRIRTALECT